MTPKHLRAFRRHFGLSQAKAATLLGVTRVSWCRWETGASPLPVYMRYALVGLGRELKKAGGPAKEE
jgi:DNA-binding XRE family transcriptional regulator